MPDIWQATRWGYVPVDPDDGPDYPTRCEGPAYPDSHGCGRFLAAKSWMCERCRQESDDWWRVDIAREAQRQAEQEAREAAWWLSPEGQEALAIADMEAAYAAGYYAEHENSGDKPLSDDDLPY